LKLKKSIESKQERIFLESNSTGNWRGSISGSGREGKGDRDILVFLKGSFLLFFFKTIEST
jgi:hypothetical protein